MARLSLLAVVFLVHFVSKGFCDKEQNEVSTAETLKLLRKYGYLQKLGKGVSDFVNPATYRGALKAFQRFGGIKVTGVLDKATVQLLKKPRCGNPDFRRDSLRHARHRRQSGYYGSMLGYTNMTYRITGFSSDLTHEQQESEIARAFKTWSDHSALTFRRVSSSSNAVIDILFAAGKHGDRDPFDGPGGTLAHAVANPFPTPGDAHFDEDETWTVETSEGRNLFQVAVHEFGHVLGFAHSDDKTSVMYPYYQGYSINYTLNQDDINVIQALYGRNDEMPKASASSTTTTTSTTKTTSATPHPPDLCDDPSIEASAMYRRNGTKTLCLFKQGHVVQLTWAELQQAPSTIIPVPIEESIFKNGPSGTIDAALYWTYPARTYLFKGAQVWRYEEEGLKPGYPVTISQEFPGIPNDIDGAVRNSSNYKTYFFKGRQFWSYHQYHGVDDGYPKEIEPHWNGFSGDIDAASEVIKGIINLSSGDSLYVLSPGFPIKKLTMKSIIGCSDDHELREFNVHSPFDADDNEDEDAYIDDGFHTDDSGHLYPTLATLLISLALVLLM